MMMPADHGGEGSRDAALAGEYVLGVLSSARRRAVEARMREDRAFAALVAGWQQKLEPLDDAYGTEAPPAAVYAAIRQRLFSETSAVRRPLASRLWASAALWRGVALAAVIIAFAFVGYDRWMIGPTAPTLMAELAGPDAAVNLVARFDARNGVVSITPVAAGGPDQKSLELWLIEGEGPPVALGVLPQNGAGRLVVPQAISAKIGAGAHFAVSIEPYGGSPTGQPTGPVIAVGELRSL